MSLLIMRKGKVITAEDDWDLLENHPSKPNEVCIWPFERSRAGKITVNYADGAIAIFTGSSFSNLCEYLRELHEKQGWPKPHVFGSPLANIGLCAGDEPEDEPEAPAPEEVVPEEQPDETEDIPPEPAPVHRRRQRVAEEQQHAPVAEPHKRRRREENPERIRRVRSG
jgi:hypothetical protein